MRTMPIVTQELLEQGMSLNGAWNSAQLKALGVKTIWHNKGWKSRLLGSKVTQEQINEFLSLTNRHLAHKSREMPEQHKLWQETYSHLNSIKQEIRNAIA